VPSQVAIPAYDLKGTANELSGESAFDHISVLQGLGTFVFLNIYMSMSLLAIAFYCPISGVYKG
jgi:hypothetical protein